MRNNTITIQLLLSTVLTSNKARITIAIITKNLTRVYSNKLLYTPILFPKLPLAIKAIDNSYNAIISLTARILYCLKKTQ
jgi:hypothetical protein